jgi:hypothetical protein
MHNVHGVANVLTFVPVCVALPVTVVTGVMYVMIIVLLLFDQREGRAPSSRRVAQRACQSIAGHDKVKQLDQATLEQQGGS